MTLLRGHAFLRDFFEQFAWRRLEPSPGLVSGDVLFLAEEGRCCVLYLPNGAPATVTLAPGDYALQRYNPRTGETLSLGTVAAPLWTPPEMPNTEDWALRLTLSERNEQ